MFPLHEPLNDVLREELKEFDDLTAALLARRGIRTREEAQDFLNPSYDTHLHDPLLMTGMQKAAERLAAAIFSGERIAVWSDYDCDGIPGGVILYDFLKKTGANFEIYIPHRHDEGYGMNISGIEKLAKVGTKLIVTVDSGITAHAAIAHAKELGVSVIVTDHHLAGESLPDAFAIVNPNARADEPYPFRELSGSAVAWKLVCATLSVCPKLKEKIQTGFEKWLLDMVGIATIADMAPLTGENRVLASYGLLVLRKSPRVGLQKLCRLIRVNQRTLTEDDVAFMIAPRINAASRMGDARDAFHLFTTTDENEADRLANKLEHANRRRKAEAGSITRSIHSRLRSRIGLPSVIVLGDPEWRPSLLGLVAGNIADEYERPVFLWGREGNGIIKGSVRSPSIHALELMTAAKETFAEFGGHAAAGGFTVRDDEIFSLENNLIAAYEHISDTRHVRNDLTLRTDAAILPEEATATLLAKIERLSPFGVENPKPVFLLREVCIKEITSFGKGREHIKIRIESNNCTLDAVSFFTKGSLARELDKTRTGSLINLLAHLERDSFSKNNQVRLRLLDFRLV